MDESSDQVPAGWLSVGLVADHSGCGRFLHRFAGGEFIRHAEGIADYRTQNSGADSFLFPFFLPRIHLNIHFPSVSI